MATNLVSTAELEVLATGPTTNVLVSASELEVLATGPASTNARVSGAFIEALVSVNAVPAGGGAKPIVIILG